MNLGLVEWTEDVNRMEHKLITFKMPAFTCADCSMKNCVIYYITEPFEDIRERDFAHKFNRK